MRCAPRPRPAWACRDSGSGGASRFRRRRGNPDAPLKALIIDSWFDNYVGVVMLVRVVDGVLQPKDKIRSWPPARSICASRSACSRPNRSTGRSLSAGEVGFVIAGIKELKAAKVGDTMTLADQPASEALPGFKEIKPQVFAGLYPVESHDYEALRDALEKLQAQRCLAAVRAGSFAGAGLRLPLRLPRPAAHGDRAGAAGTRIRHGPHHHRADGGVRGGAARRHGARDRESVQAARAVQDRGNPRADHHRDDLGAAGISWAP